MDYVHWMMKIFYSYAISLIPFIDTLNFNSWECFQKWFKVKKWNQRIIYSFTALNWIKWLNLCEI